MHTKRRLSALVLTVLTLPGASAYGQAPPSSSAAPLAPRPSIKSAEPEPDRSVPAEPIAVLRELIDDSLEHNPAIAAMARSFDAMQARVPQAKAWPQPMLEVGSMGNIVPFDVQNGDPSSARIVTVTQEVMWPGKLSLMGKMAGAEAEAEWWAYEQMRREVVAEVKDSYFELSYLTKAVEIIEKNRILMERILKITEARYAVGRGMQTDVLKAQLEVAMLSEKLFMFEQRRRTAVARLNSLLYRNPDSPLGRPAEITPREFTFRLADLLEASLASPILKQQRRRIDKEQFAVRLAEKQYYPDMSVTYSYLNRPGMPEMHGVMFGLKLPLYFWQKQRPAVVEAVAGAAAEQKRLENATALLFFKIKDSYLMATTADRLASLYGTALIPQSALVVESSIAAYESGTVDYLMLLDSLVTLRTYELGYYEQLSAKERAIAMLEPLVGVPLRP